MEERGRGRPTKAQEQKTASIAQAAITGKFGSIEEGFKWLLESKEPALIKFVFEHGFGKAPETIEHSGDVNHTITYKVVRGTGDSGQ